MDDVKAEEHDVPFFPGGHQILKDPFRSGQLAIAEESFKLRLGNIFSFIELSSLAVYSNFSSTENSLIEAQPDHTPGRHDLGDLLVEYDYRPGIREESIVDAVVGPSKPLVLCFHYGGLQTVNRLRCAPKF